MTLRDVGRRILGWWAVRLVLVLVFLFIAVILRDVVMGLCGTLLSLGADAPPLYLAPSRTPSTVTAIGVLYSIIAFLTMAGLAIAAYALQARWVERRTPSEVGLRGAGREVSAGMVIGCGLALTVAGILAVGGYARIDGWNPWLAVMPGIAFMATAAWMEELVLRGVVFRFVEEKLGTWGALIIGAALFGVLHQSNPNASWISTLAIAVSGGLLLGMAYVVTRRLWLAIGLHFGWNATQLVLGLPVSGNELPGLLTTQLTGPTALTGGSFGIEGSIIVPVLGALVTGMMAWRSIRLGHTIPPMWKRAV
jgi:CAAX protease family protein